MKKGKFIALAVLGGALVFPTQAEKVRIEELPKDVQDKIRAHTGSARIEDIDRGTRDGRTTYEVGFKREGQHTELLFDQSGNLLTGAGQSALDSRKISYDELPENVKKAAAARLQGAEVNDVDRRVREGQVTYEIGFKRAGGQQQELLIAGDGRILRDVPMPEIAVGAPPVGTTSVDRGAPVDRGTPTIHSRQMSYRELPSNIRRISDARLRNGHVTGVERQLEGGDIRYHIEFTKDDGRVQSLVIREDGTVVRDEFAPSSAVGAPGGAATGAGSSAALSQDAEYRHISAPVRLANSREIDEYALPVVVHRAMSRAASDDAIERVQRGTWQDMTVYQIGFRDDNNRYVEIQLDENGRVIHDTRGTSGFLQPLLQQLQRGLSD